MFYVNKSLKMQLIREHTKLQIFLYLQFIIVCLYKHDFT